MASQQIEYKLVKETHSVSLDERVIISSKGEKYLRADTCTPNEKLEELIREMEQEIMSQAGPNDYGNAVRTMGKFVIKRLREVMK